MKLVGGLRHRRAGRRKLDRDGELAVQSQSGNFDGAMAVVKQALHDLEIARRQSAPAAAVRDAHARIDAALGRAAAAANAVFTALFEAAGGTHHGETDPEVIVWKRRLNTALTLRSQHQMSQGDDESSLPVAAVRVASRAAYGPHQAGMDFDTDPSGEMSWSSAAT
jgi:hypothetical protein